MVMEAEDVEEVEIPYRPEEEIEEEEEEEEEFDPDEAFRFFSNDDENFEGEEVEIPYRPEEEERPAELNYTENIGVQEYEERSLLRDIENIDLSPLDPVEDEEDLMSLPAKISKRTEKSLKWIEKGMPEGSKLSGVIRNALADIDPEDSENAQLILNSAHNIAGFFNEIPDATAEAAFKTGDNIINAFGSLIHSASELFPEGEFADGTKHPDIPYTEFRELDNIIKDSDNPITQIYTGMLEWWLGYKAVGGKGVLNLKDMALLSPVATYLTTDSDQEELAEFLKVHNIFPKFMVEYQETVIPFINERLGTEEDDAVVTKKIKKMVQEELLGLAIVGGGVGATKGTGWFIGKMSDFIGDRLKIMHEKKKLKRLKQGLDDYLKDETATLSLKGELGDPEFITTDVLEGLADDARQAFLDDNISSAVDALNNPKIESKEQVIEELATALHSLDKYAAPSQLKEHLAETIKKTGETLGSYGKMPLTEEVVQKGGMLSYDSYLALRKNIIRQGHNKAKHSKALEEINVKKAKLEEEVNIEREKAADTALPEYDHVTFHPKEGTRWTDTKEAYFTITPDGFKINASAYRSIKDFNKAVRALIDTKEFDAKWAKEFEKKIELDRRGVIADEVAFKFIGYDELDAKTVLDKLRNRPIGKALTNEEGFAANILVTQHLQDIGANIRGLIKEGGQLGLDSVSDEVVVDNLDMVIDVFENILPSLFGSFSEHGRSLRTQFISGGRTLRKRATYIAEQMNAYGGKEKTREYLKMFAELVDEADFEYIMKVAQSSGVKPLERIVNAWLGFRASNLVASTSSWTTSLISGGLMTGAYTGERLLQPLVSLLSFKHGIQGHAHMADWIGLAHGLIPSFYESLRLFGKHAWNIFSLGPVKSQIDPKHTRMQGMDTNIFKDTRPKELLEKGWGRYFDENRTLGTAHGLANVAEFLAKIGTANHIGFKGQLMIDEVFKGFVFKMHLDVLASRQAVRNVKAGTASNPITEFYRIRKEPNVFMAREAMDHGRRATFTLPIFKEVAPMATHIYNLTRNPMYKWIGQLVTPFITPALNASRYAVESNLITGRAQRLLNKFPAFKTDLSAGQAEERLTRELMGTMVIGYVTNSLMSKEWATGLEDGDSRMRMLRREAGLSTKYESITFPDVHGTARNYKITKYDPFGRMINLCAELGKIFRHESNEESGSLLRTMGVALGTYLDPGFLFDFLAFVKDMEGMTAGVDEKHSKWVRKKYLDKAATWIPQLTLPLYSLSNEVRKATDPVRRQSFHGLGIARAADYEQYVKAQVEAGKGTVEAHMYIGMDLWERFTAEYKKAIPGLSYDVPAELNMWGKVKLSPNHMGPEAAFELPQGLSALLKRMNLWFDGDKLAVGWRTIEHEASYDKDWLGKDGLGRAVIHDREKLDQLAQDLVYKIKQEHPRISRDSDEMLKQVRVYLEIEALRAEDLRRKKSKDFNKESRIGSLKPTNRISFYPKDRSDLRETVNLSPKDYNNFIIMMNDKDLFSSPGNVYKGKSYLDAMYEMITSNYKGTGPRNPHLLFGELRDIQREYRERAEERFLEAHPTFFDSLRESAVEHDKVDSLDL